MTWTSGATDAQAGLYKGEALPGQHGEHLLAVAVHGRAAGRESLGRAERRGAGRESLLDVHEDHAQVYFFVGLASR